MALSAAAVVPFHFMGRAPSGEGGWRVRMPATHDVAMHFDHLRSFSRSLASGVPLPRWEEEANGGFGAPSLEFHPPGVYYVASLVHAAIPDWGATFLFTHLLVMVLSGAALYRCARSRLCRGPAAVAMSAYIVMPYHLVDLYHRGALAEWLAFVWMPLAWRCTERLFEPMPLGPRLRWTAGLGVAYGGFLWSHPPTCHQFTLALGVLAALLALRRRDPRGPLLLGGALTLGVGLSAAYLYPALVEQHLINRDLFLSRWVYAEHYVFRALPPAEAPPAFWRLIQQNWLFATLGWILAGAVLLGRRVAPRESPRLREGVVLWTATGAVVSLLMTPLAAPLEELVPGLEMTCFPWRMLAISSLVLALLAGACAEVAAEAMRAGPPGAGRLPGFVCLAVLIGAAVFSGGLVVHPRWGETSFQPRPARPPADKPEMIPLTAPRDPRTLPQLDRATLAAGHGRVAVQRWDPERRRLRVDLDGSDRLQVRTFKFPGWTATVDGRPASIEMGPVGNIELSLPAGSHDVTLDYDGTPPRRAGAVISAVAAVVLVGLLIGSRASRRTA